MITGLIAMEWTAIGGTAAACLVIVAAFAATVVGEFRRVPATHWQAGEWHPRTPAAATWPLAIGMTPAAVEAEITRLAATIPDRPA